MTVLMRRVVRRPERPVRALGIAAVVLVLAAGGAAVVADRAPEPSGTVAVEPAIPPAATTDGAAAVPGAADRAAASGGEARSEAAPPGAAQPLDAIGRDVVRTAQLGVEVPDVAAAARRVRAATTGAGGAVAEEQVGTGGSWLVLRVPAEVLDRVVEDVAALGTVLTRSGRAEDVTEQVVDLDARVASQEAGVARVRALLAEARDLGDVIAVESELARREADLESLKARVAVLRDQVALSTLTVELRAAPAPAAAPAPGFLGGLAAGWTGLRAVGSGLAAAAGFALPFLPLLAVAAGVWWLVSRVRRRRALRREALRRSGPGDEGDS